MKKTMILFALVFSFLTCTLFGRDIGKELREKRIHVACLSEEDKINLQINKLEQAIRQQNIGTILGIISPEYLENNSLFGEKHLSETLERSFSNFSNNRRFSPQVNEKTGWTITATQDFYIRSVKTQINHKKAMVECDVGFLLTPNHHTLKTLAFAMVGPNWFLSEFEQLFSFIENVSIEINDRRQFTDVFGSSPILSFTEEDFVSTNSLSSTLLYSYEGNVIHRMNMLVCQLLWGFTDGFITPYGIVADIEIWEGGPDFNHEYLFVSDPMGNNIVASDQDNWLADYGEWGDGVGQFAGPYGICTIDGYYYFIADKFNDRVTCYIYYNQLDEPQWHSDLNLYAYFNHPRDVEAKDPDPNDEQDITYIAVADENNHRIVLFHWAPFILGFDRAYGEYGSGEGQFMWPTSVCFGRDPESGYQTNDVYVTDYGNRRLIRFYISPENVIWRGSYQFPIGAELTSVDVDNKGLLYVIDRQNGKVYKFAPSQNYPYYFSLLGIWGEKGIQDGQLYYPNMLQVAHGRYVPNPADPGWIPLGLGDVFISEFWGDLTGVRRFVIDADILNLSAEWIPYNEDTGEGNFIWWEYHLTDFATVTEKVLLGAEVCTTYNEGSLNWGSQAGTWPVDGHPHGTYYTVKVTATSIYDPTIVVEKSVDIYVDTSTIRNPVITRGIRCNYESPLPFWCDDGYECIKENNFYTIDVQAYDPNGYPLTYEWSCAQGDFWDGTVLYKKITTSENYVCYVAPPPCGKDEDYERVMVKVKNSIGGNSGTSLNPTPYLFGSEISCDCGDVNDDGIVNVGDVIYLTAYLYKGGPPPVPPTERGDVNNDCIVNVGDLTYMVNYLYRKGLPPECCWLHE